MALAKRVMQLAKQGTELPSGVHAYRRVRYDPAPQGLDNAAGELALGVEAALEQARTRPGGTHVQ
jgi:hypothetical protein